MPTYTNETQAPFSQGFQVPAIPEDWLAVIIAFLLILLSAIGLLSPHGINITF